MKGFKITYDSRLGIGKELGGGKEKVQKKIRGGEVPRSTGGLVPLQCIKYYALAINTFVWQSNRIYMYTYT